KPVSELISHKNQLSEKPDLDLGFHRICASIFRLMGGSDDGGEV
ncbi:hypothetical protein SOVF_027890, partial [Spinacia oleracea]